MTLAGELGVDSVLDVLQSKFGMEGRRSGNELSVRCPNPGHDDINPSCGVNLTTGLWGCFSCGTSGDLVTLGMVVLNEPRESVERALRPGTAESLLVSIRHRLAAVAHHRPRQHLPVLPGPYEDGPLTALLERGFSAKTLRRWGIRWVTYDSLEGSRGPFTVRDSLAIPIRDEQGRLLAWCYRRTRSSPRWQPKYLYTPGVPLSELWFGVHHHAQAPEVVIVEGALDAMAVDQAGYPALALLGSQMGNRKLGWLRRYRSVTLFGDRDSAGALAVERVGAAIASSMPVKVCRYPSWVHAHDPQELACVDLEIVLSRAVPWQTYQLSKISSSSDTRRPARSTS